MWNSGCRLKKWLPVTTNSNYLFSTSPFYTLAWLYLDSVSYLSFFKKSAWVHVCAWVHTCHSMYVEARRQLVGVSSLFLPYGSQWLNSGHQAWGQEMSPRETSRWPLQVLIFFLRRDLMYPRLVSSLLCSWWWSPTTPVLLSLCPPVLLSCVETTGMCYMHGPISSDIEGFPLMAFILF